MALTVLERHDKPTASAILAAGVLASTANTGLPQDLTPINKYKGEVELLLAEVRQKLNLQGADQSPDALIQIQGYLSKLIDSSVRNDDDQALNRVAQLGLLSPGAYRVEQPAAFVSRFYSLGVSKSQVQEAVLHADEVQHLLAEVANPGEEDSLSLFLKMVPARRKGKAHWLLVQTVRDGIRQIAQAAWRVFPEDVDLRDATNGLDVMKAFAEAFGRNMRVEDFSGKFLSATSIPATQSELRFAVEESPHAETFISWSHRSTNMVGKKIVGIMYAIDIPRYRESLRAHGFNV